jgi:hypothetical protein
MRLEGWEQRVSDIITTSRDVPYKLGENDCFRLTCRVVEAITGVDRWPELSGYTTKRESLKKLHEHGSTFEAAGDWFFGAPSISVKRARRGDICCIEDSTGEKHLGVCMGQYTYGIEDAGLLSVLTLTCKCAWAVG